MKSKFYFLLVILVIALTLSACGGASEDQVDLDGTSWVLFAYRKTAPIESAKPTLRFEDGQVSGNASCNSYGGSYEVDGDKISFGAMFMTEMYCMDPEEVMDQESVYLEMLGDSQSFEISEGRLILHMSGQETLTFVPAE